MIYNHVIMQLSFITITIMTKKLIDQWQWSDMTNYGLCHYFQSKGQIGSSFWKHEHILYQHSY